MKKQFIYFLSLFVMCLAACSNPVDPTALNLDSANINRLIPFRGELNNGVKQLYPEEPYKAFWAENWKTPEQSISWKVNTDGEDYMAEMIVSVNRMGRWGRNGVGIIQWNGQCYLPDKYNRMAALPVPPSFTF